MKNPADHALDAMNEALKIDGPVIGIENTGIGSYEYWGAKCFDHGEDVPFIDEDERIVKISRSEYTTNDIKEIIFELLTRKHNVTLYYDTKHDTEQIEAVYTIKEISIKDSIEILIQWDEIN